MRMANLNRKVILFMIAMLLLLVTMACSLGDLIGGRVVEPEPAGQGGIAGRIWHDRCANPPQGAPVPDVYPPGCVLDPSSGLLIANSLLDADEGGIESVELILGRGLCPGEPIKTTMSAPDGMFLFAGLDQDNYCITIDPRSSQNANIIESGRWTYPAIIDPTGPMAVNVVLAKDEVRADVYFAWDFALEPLYQAPSVATPTENLTPSPEPSATTTPEPTGTLEPTGSPTPSPSPTFSVEDPRASLGDPTWEDDLEDDGDFYLYGDEHVNFEMADGVMKLTAYNPDFYSGWSLGWRKDSNMYLEATFSVSTCSERDTIGLVLRAPDVGKGYLYGISCDGRYSLRFWDGAEMKRIQDWIKHPALKSGSNQTQRVAVWTNGNLIRLYANGQLLKEIVDTTFTDDGLFGVFISSAQTSNFQAQMSEFLYWASP